MHDGTGKRSGSTLTLSLRATVVRRAHSGTGGSASFHFPSSCRAHLAGFVTDCPRSREPNGTYVNERRIDSGEVRAGQLLRFGSVTFLIEAGPNAYSPDAETQSVSQAHDSIVAEVEKLDLTAA